MDHSKYFFSPIDSNFRFYSFNKTNLKLSTQFSEKWTFQTLLYRIAKTIWPNFICVWMNKYRQIETTIFSIVNVIILIMKYFLFAYLGCFHYLRAKFSPTFRQAYACCFQGSSGVQNIEMRSSSTSKKPSRKMDIQNYFLISRFFNVTTMIGNG